MSIENIMPPPVSAEDERTITAIILRYATGIDTRDWTLFRTCFAEDFEADYGSFGQWRGPREITDFMREAHLQVGPTLHRITNITLTREGDHIRARSYVDAFLAPLAAGGPEHRGIGWYDDRFARTAQGWKLARRTFNPVHLS